MAICIFFVMCGWIYAKNDYKISFEKKTQEKREYTSKIEPVYLKNYIEVSFPNQKGTNSK